MSVTGILLFAGLVTAGVVMPLRLLADGEITSGAAALVLGGGAGTLAAAEIIRRLVRAGIGVRTSAVEGRTELAEAQRESETVRSRAAQERADQERMRRMQDEIDELTRRLNEALGRIDQLQGALRAKMPEAPWAWWITEVRQRETAHRFVFFNQAFRFLVLRVAGDVSDIIGKTVAEVLGEDGARRVAEIDADALASASHEATRVGVKLHPRLAEMVVTKSISGPGMGGMQSSDSGRILYTGLAFRVPPPPKEISAPSS